MREGRLSIDAAGEIISADIEPTIRDVAISCFRFTYSRRFPTSIFSKDFYSGLAVRYPCL